MRGRSLEEIEAIFLSSKSIFDTVRVAREINVEGDIVPADSENKKAVDVELRETV